MIDSSTCPRLQRFRTSSRPNEAFFSRCHRSVKIYLASSYDVEQKLWITAVTPPLLYPLLPHSHSAQNHHHHNYSIIVFDVIINIITNIISSSRTEALNNSRNVPIALSVIALPPQPMLWLRKIVYIFPSICFSSQCLLQVLKSFQWFLPTEKHFRLSNCKLANSMGDN